MNEYEERKHKKVQEEVTRSTGGMENKTAKQREGRSSSKKTL